MNFFHSHGFLIVYRISIFDICWLMKIFFINSDNWLESSCVTCTINWCLRTKFRSSAYFVLTHLHVSVVTLRLHVKPLERAWNYWEVFTMDVLVLMWIYSTRAASLHLVYHAYMNDTLGLFNIDPTLQCQTKRLLGTESNITEALNNLNRAHGSMQMSSLQPTMNLRPNKSLSFSYRNVNRVPWMLPTIGNFKP